MKMNKIIIAISIAAGIFSCAGNSYATVNVFACEPEWKALAEEIGKDKVSATSATTAEEDTHHIRAKPSLIAKMRSADLLVCTGAGLEVGWLPILLQKASSKLTTVDGDGYLEASNYVQILDKPASVDRSQGDVHPDGNPHIQLSPYNILNVAAELTKRLQKIDPDNAKYYSDNYLQFEKEWKVKIAEWEAAAKSIKGKKYVVYHTQWVYLFKWLGLEQLAMLEPKPGVSPTASHLQQVLSDVESFKPDAILVAPFEDNAAAEWLSEKSGLPVIRMPFTVGGNTSANNLQGLFNSTIELLRSGGK